MQPYAPAPDLDVPDVTTRLLVRVAGWAVLVLVLLLSGTRRFSELRREVGGVSEKMLAQTLKTLEQDGLILRTVYPTVPPKVEYQLTFEGSQIAARVNQLIEYLEQHLPETSQQSSK